MGVMETENSDIPGTVYLGGDGLEDARDACTIVELGGEVLHFFAQFSCDVLLLGRNGLLKSVHFSLERPELTDVVFKRLV